MQIVAISGHAGHGKDTAAQMLKDALERRGLTVLIAHYADLLKYICAQYFGWDGQKDEKGRSLLQRVGTDIIRAQAPNFWVAWLGVLICLFKDQWDCVLIPDARFPNEIDYLKAFDGFSVTHLRVSRPDYDNGLTDEQKSHPSETALEGVTPDIVVVNDGSLTDLTAKMDDIAEDFINGKHE